MSKDSQLIMAVRKSTLMPDGHFQGFQSANKDEDYENIILGHYNWLRRGPVEEDRKFKQPIGYAIVMHEPTNTIFAYQRADNGNEARLQSKWSWGVGGHIELVDVHDRNPIESSLRREIQEEIGLDQFNSIEVIGYINDEESPVSQVHFGILYLIKSELKVATSLDPNEEIQQAGYYTLEQLEEMAESENVENWSKIALKGLA